MTDIATTEDHDTHDAHHPTERQYWLVFLALVVITAAEVAWSYAGIDGIAYLLPLFAMMLLKFVLVAGVFMHLYFDAKVLNGKLFWMVFASGIVIIVLIALAIFGTYEFEI